MRSRLIVPLCFFAMSLASSPGLSAEEPVGQRLLRLDGPVLLSVDGLEDLRESPVQEGVQFGAFQRDDRRPASQEYAKYWLKQIESPTGEQQSFLTLYYNVSAKDSYAGLWIKLAGAKWLEHKNSDLVLRLRRFEPLNEVEIYDNDRKLIRDTQCASSIKVELKTLPKANAKPESFALREYFGSSARLQQQEKGYFDVRIPLRSFGFEDQLSRLGELAIVFENREAIGKTRGNLGIQAIFLEQRDEPLKDVSVASFEAESVTVRDNPVIQAAVAVSATEPVTLNGPMILQFDAPLNQLRIPETQFGIFRDEQPRHVQFISARWETADYFHRARPVGYLALDYEVPSAYNGWWLKLNGADFSPYREGQLILRVKPGKNCTPVFKVELKTLEGGISHYAYVRMRQSEIDEAEKNGYVDLKVPLYAFGIRDLSHMAELVIVFESNRIPHDKQKGTLLIESIRLTQTADGIDGLSSNSLLDDLGWLAFRWFQDARHPETGHPETGMVLDRMPNWRDRGKRSNMSSIASTGYFLTLLAEWVRLGYLRKDQAEQQALQTLEFIDQKLEGHAGLYYHFCVDSTGKRFAKCEVSTLDSAILLNGCACCSVFFGGRVAELADKLIDDARWDQFIMEHPQTGKKLLSLGWKPELGLLSASDVRSSEMAMSLFLAIGSRTHPIPVECWYNTAVDYGDLAGHRVLNARHPHFTSYYGLGWHDLRGKVDKDGVDLWSNAKEASLGNRAFCASLGKQYSTYSKEAKSWWSISAGDSPNGYVAASPVWGEPDGTVWPLSALSALPFIPEIVEKDLQSWRRSPVWKDVCGQYGLSPFNLEHKTKTEKCYVADDLIGIDLGAFAVGLANHSNETVWNLWTEHPVSKRVLNKISITPVEKPLDDGK